MGCDLEVRGNVARGWVILHGQWKTSATRHPKVLTCVALTAFFGSAVTALGQAICGVLKTCSSSLAKRVRPNLVHIRSSFSLTVAG